MRIGFILSKVQLIQVQRIEKKMHWLSTKTDVMMSEALQPSSTELYYLVINNFEENNWTKMEGFSLCMYICFNNCKSDSLLILYVMLTFMSCMQ
mgnify:CR=1 FL=1